MAFRKLTKDYEAGHYSACAQYSMAMVTGLEVSEVIKSMGHAGSSSVSEIMLTFMRLGYLYRNVGITGAGEDAVVIVQNDEAGHALAYHNGKIYDPDNGHEYEGFEELAVMCNEVDARVTHVFAVTPVQTREWVVGGQKEETV